MEKIVIEKNVPIPPRRFGLASCYPFEKMNIGDSFLLKENMAGNNSIPGYANRQFKPKRFVGRKEGKGRRIWRIA